jgi:hypothetical protein
MGRVKAGWLLVGLSALLSACGDSGLTGRWHGELTVTAGAELWLTIEENDEFVFGSARYRDPDEDLRSGVSGSVIEGKVELDFSDLDGAPHYSAKTHGDTGMTGNWTRNGVSEKLLMQRQGE